MVTSSYRPHDLHAAAGAALRLAAQGFFWTGSEAVTTAAGPALRGQTYVEYWIPAELRRPFPIVMIHGGGGQGLDYLGTADGREGWAHRFVRAGYAVYVVDRPGHGRSPYYPELLGEMGPPFPTGFLERMFTRVADFADNWPQAQRHDKWPDGGAFGDPAFDRFLASGGPSPSDFERHHRDCQRGGAELLDLIGPAIVMTHSAGAPTGWLMADARPDLVEAIIAVEPIGPPFDPRMGGMLKWGLTGAPMAFDPPVSAPEDFALEERAPVRPGTAPCLVQREPPRQLPNLRGIPIVVVTSEASWMAVDNHGVVDFLAQAGATIEHLRLDEHGVAGNGHMLMLETNSDEVADTIGGWLAAKGLA